MEKLKRKNSGNQKLSRAIDALVSDIEAFSGDALEMKRRRPDADKVHSDGFYFFNLHVHRTMLLLEFSDGEATVIWADSHDKYERTFQNNKKVIEAWLRSRELIE